EKLADLEHKLASIEKEFQILLQAVPNITFDDVPLGGEEDSVEIRKWGDQSTGARDHLELAVERDWVDFERGAKVAGAKFYFLKGDLALLEQALIHYAIDFVTTRGFTFMSVPHMVN